jgi:DNA-binding NarL/FixJ family response regulator
MSLRILDIGQCGFDGPRMGKLLHEKLGAKVDCAAGLEDARQLLATNKFDIILVNRVLAADGGSGLEVIQSLARSSHPPLMLVSDHEEAQDAAVSLGAHRGFGKAKLYDPATLNLIAVAAGKDAN